MLCVGHASNREIIREKARHSCKTRQTIKYDDIASNVFSQGFERSEF